MNGLLAIVLGAILFWGWETSLLPLAIVMAILVTGSSLSPRRFALGTTEFHRALDICWVLALGGLLLVYSRESVGNLLRTFAQGLPIVALPALLAQVWSTDQRVPLSALLPLPRWRTRPQHANPALDLRAAYLVACLLSASIAGAARPWFYPAALALLGGALWFHRTRAARPPATGILFLLAALGGWLISSALALAQPWIENRVLDWTSRLDREGSPSRVSRTSIGHRGRVGGSSRVALQVRSESPSLAVPNLFRVATFSSWRDGSWYAAQGDFEKIESNTDEWVIHRNGPPAGTLLLEWARTRTSDLVPLPPSAGVLRDLVADKVERTPLGTVRAESKAGLVSLRTDLTTLDAPEALPSDEDRGGIPALERKTVALIADDLELAQQTAAEAVARLERFYFTQFEYTLDLLDLPVEGVEAPTPLSRFLLGHRRGHCEYFATSATLILRAAGIPARYVTGFLVSPTERSDGFIVVRESQAHAWVRFWNETTQTWQDFDPTPPVGLDAIASPRTWWDSFRSAWHDHTFGLLRWWWLGEKRLLRQAYWLAVPLLALLLWRFRTLRTSRSATDSASRNHRLWPGTDSEWFEIQSLLDQRGWSRQSHENPAHWHLRLSRDGWDTVDAARLHHAHRLHQRLRFDPAGLAGGDRSQLRDLVRLLITRLSHGLRPPGP